MFYVEMLNVNAQHVDGFLSTDANPINRIRMSAHGCGQRQDASHYIVYDLNGNAMTDSPVSIW